MKTQQPASHRASESDTLTRYDEVGSLVRCFVLPPAADPSVQRRLNDLTQRIVAHRYLQALNAHMSVHGSEVRRCALLLRPWTALAVPIA
jgi:hypothetical protein